MRRVKVRLVRVRSQSELRAGMTVVMAPCADCRKVHAALLAREVVGGLCHNSECRRRLCWEALGDCPPGPNQLAQLCFCNAIQEGRLWRLAARSVAYHSVTP